MCLQSDQQLRLRVPKKQNEPSIPVTAMEGEIGTHDSDSCTLGSFKSSSTHQNIENSSVQEPLETAEQEVKPEVTEANDVDIDQLLEDCRDSQGNLSEFIKNEPIEDNDQQLQKQNDEPDMEDNDDGDTIQSIISGKDAVMAIESEAQQENESNVKKHHSRHAEDDKPYKCHYCRRKFNTISIMNQHKARHEVACDICGKTIGKSSLKNHKLTHSNEKAHKCDFCGKCFSQISYLRSHIRKHTGEKPYKCKYCERFFNDPSNHMKHMRVHFGDNIYRCELCPLAFPAAKKLRAHLTEHKNEDSKTREHNMKALQEAEVKLQLELSKKLIQKAPKCDFCGKRFTLLKDLRNHIRTHTGEKPYKCKYCDRSFTQAYRRTKHMRLHLGDNIYRCELCPLAFSFAKELRAHLTEHNNDDSETRERNMKALKEAEAKLQLKLSETETQQPSKEETKQKLEIKAKEYVKAHSIIQGEDKPYEFGGKLHKCHLCEKSFSTMENLRIHIRRHTGEKLYQCKYCKQPFPDSSRCIKHMRVHLGDNVHRCELCPSAFPLASELRIHVTTHKNEDPETRERNMEALKEAEAKIELEWRTKVHKHPLFPFDLM